MLIQAGWRKLPTPRLSRSRQSRLVRYGESTSWGRSKQAQTLCSKARLKSRILCRFVRLVGTGRVVNSMPTESGSDLRKQVNKETYSRLAPIGSSFSKSMHTTRKVG